jgi:hypothetical protein
MILSLLPYITGRIAEVFPEIDNEMGIKPVAGFFRNRFHKEIGSFKQLMGLFHPRRQTAGNEPLGQAGEYGNVRGAQAEKRRG